MVLHCRRYFSYHVKENWMEFLSYQFDTTRMMYLKYKLCNTVLSEVYGFHLLFCVLLT